MSGSPTPLMDTKTSPARTSRFSASLPGFTAEMIARSSSRVDVSRKVRPAFGHLEYHITFLM